MNPGVLATLVAVDASLADPPASSVLFAAADWVQGTLLGTFATIIAVIAIAAIGLMMLSGRIDLRRGLVTVTGCFILFGAPAIAQALRGISGGGEMVAISEPPPSPLPPLPQAPPSQQISPYDPYAGASVPR